VPKPKQSLVALASVLALVGLVTLLAPSPTRGQKPNAPGGPSKPVMVGNVVQTQAAVPPGAFSSVVTGVGVFSGADPEGTSYAITSITVANTSGGPTTATLGAVWGVTGDCSSFGSITSHAAGPTVAVPAGETVHLSFPQPFVLSARPGAAACLRNSLAGGEAEITVVGYRF
jgi:hypothetical protein